MSEKKELHSQAIDHVKPFDMLKIYVFRKVVCILWLNQSGARCVFCLRPMRRLHRSGRPDVEETWFLAGGKPLALTLQQMPTVVTSDLQAVQVNRLGKVAE